MTGSEENLNQPPPLTDYNLWTADLPLREAVEREGAGFIATRAEQCGALLGREETWRLGELANRFPPELRTHDRFGNRVDEVDFLVLLRQLVTRPQAAPPAEEASAVAARERPGRRVVGH